MAHKSKYKKYSKKGGKFVGGKIKKILAEGVRKNTKKPVSSSNPRRKVSHKQAIAIALSMARKKGLKVSKKVRNHKLPV